MQSLDFEHIGSLAAVAESLSPGSRWRRVLTSVHIVIFQAKINVLLPFGPLAVFVRRVLTSVHIVIFQAEESTCSSPSARSPSCFIKPHRQALLSGYLRRCLYRERARASGHGASVQGWSPAASASPRAAVVAEVEAARWGTPRHRATGALSESKSEAASEVAPCARLDRGIAAGDGRTSGGGGRASPSSLRGDSYVMQGSCRCGGRRLPRRSVRRRSGPACAPPAASSTVALSVNEEAVEASPSGPSRRPGLLAPIAAPRV
ncbi:hypothetical protein PR202_gn00325 [Eleusine coracana subsp. coracana]|uniref:Uncharacterized protein n=1 Tax=Eleusine coracana subsp. coracana TaxID=191504 RepID=A0AAV5G162_ELECO|nr:hypothetical protein PR202_gn00220 [Eleusine coracana subsp. coracana]GJN41006.1 hypothetical protein PR202_gn00325 [Eleusine coracana subsp. coracana]